MTETTAYMGTTSRGGKKPSVNSLQEQFGIKLSEIFKRKITQSVKVIYQVFYIEIDPGHCDNITYFEQANCVVMYMALTVACV